MNLDSIFDDAGNFSGEILRQESMTRLAHKEEEEQISGQRQ